MALSIAITDGTTTVTLSDGSVYGIPYDGLDLGYPALDMVLGTSRRASYDQLAHATYRNRKVVSTLQIHGSSLDDLITNYNNLKNLLY